MNPGHTNRLPSPPARSPRVRGLVFALCTLFSLNALAIDTSLPPEEIEQARSLGRTSNHEDLAAFLKQYEHDFPYPSDHPIAYVQSVEFQTPYEQIVLRAMRNYAYTKFQAADDYHANPGLILVRVVTSLKINYVGPPPPADAYTVVVSQSKTIEPRNTVNAATCDPNSQLIYPYPVNTDCTVYTREIVLSFDADQFAPGRVTVKVMLREGGSLETTYNLNRLK